VSGQSGVGISRPMKFHSREVRKAFTLLELLLALSLIVVATALIGSLMSLYARSFATRGEDVRRKQLARGLLTMIADDLRSVVLQYEYDQTVFEQLIGAGAMDFSSLMSEGEPATEQTEMGAMSATPGLNQSTNLSTDLANSLPTGIYCMQNQLMVDVSRIPRADEYLVQQMGFGELVDVPGDVKRITYFVQASSPMGAKDSMAQVTSGNPSLDSTAGMSGGLVRRQLDRAVTRFAEQSGMSNLLISTGDLVAPEVMALEFSFFDGTQWTYQWDSSQMGLPWLVQITLAVQSASGAERSGIQTVGSLSMLDQQQRQQFGIEIYEMTVAIPGAQLQANPTAVTGTPTGTMGAPGL
jgi:type II secretory pathway pseudopilin PulG